MTSGGTVVAGVLADRYRLTSRIAAGGMGEVWRGQDLVLDRPVAVKLLRPDLVDDESFRARFRAEARAAARLVHPGIASVYDFGESSDRAWLVLELVDGEPLSAVLQREGRLSSARVLDLVAQTGAALQAAHEAGVVHRDVKPGNLLVGADGTVKVTDFGIASTTGSATLTRTGEIVGTAGYLSPEQADGRGASPASDLYALGVVAYECLSGVRPFVADAPVAVLFAHLHTPPPPLPDDVPAAAAALVLGLLAKDPAQRPESAAVVAAQASAAREQLRTAARSPRRRDSGTRVLPAPRQIASSSSPSPQGVTSRRTQRRAVRATALLLALLAVVLGGDSLWGRSAQVPAIATGTPVGEATAAVREAGLEATQESSASDAVARGHVLAQRPDAGTEVDAGSQVVLVVSSGPPTDEAAPLPLPAPARSTAAEPVPAGTAESAAPSAEQPPVAPAPAEQRDDGADTDEAEESDEAGPDKPGKPEKPDKDEGKDEGKDESKDEGRS